MKINAKYFGEIDYEQEDIIHITDGLFAFESYTEYLPISFHGENDKMLSLQSLEDETLSFILMNPFEFFPEYTPEPDEKEWKSLGATSEQDISYYVLCVIRDTPAESTVNLRAPLMVNSLNRKAKQVILDNPNYSFRHTLGNLTNKQENKQDKGDCEC